MQRRPGRPEAQGLYDPAHEHDACGVGFVAKIDGTRSHALVHQGIEVLERLEHRGACGCDPETGDGAGILLQLPDRFLRQEAPKLGIELPPVGAYASGMIFLAQEAETRAWQEQCFERLVAECGQRFLGWRDVPVNPDRIGWLSRGAMPVIRQVFVGAGEGLDPDAFERKLYVIRRLFESAARAHGGFCYVPSLSSRTFVFTGMLMSTQIEPFYPDLTDPALESALALVHSRYSTNTFPTWDLAQPFRYMAHNGEINTLRGNRNYMRAREGTMRSSLFGADLARLYPIMKDGASDSAQFDNVLEFLALNGRELPEAILMMIPEAWENHAEMDAERRAYYEYHSFLMEPWDGPASIGFTDGRKIGAVLDRNGLRPSRWTVTKDGLVVMASETGVLDFAPERVLRKGRLQPGRIFFVDLEEGRIVEDEEIKARYIAKHPYREWVETHRALVDDLPRAPLPAELRPNPELRFLLQQVFGYTSEDLKFLLAPMVADGKWAIGSMGNDEALACLSDRPRMLYHYFKQLFAQVTNPAMDSINEGTVMSLYSTLGAEKNLLDETPEHARILRANRPILTNEELERIRQIALPGFRTRTLPALFKVGEAGEGLRSALDTLCREAASAVREGVNLLILSDRGISSDHAPIPMLMATGAVHHHLIREGLRTQCGILCETGEARDVAQFALLIGYGAGAINPYLALETIEELVADGTYLPAGVDVAKGVKNYLKASDKGLLKTMAKMGISTLQSYRGAQIFEAVGLDRDVVERCFSGTASKVSGVGYDVIAREVAMRHERAFPDDGFVYPELDPGGIYQWRRRGERHTFNPDTVSKLQHAVREADPARAFATFKEFSKAANDEAERLCTLRGLFRFQWAPQPVPLDEVEPASEIVKRFCTGAMSYGSISIEAHEALAIAMNRMGGRSNTGEGGEDPARFIPDPNGDSRRSAIKQVASGRFGVTSWYLVNADELQIKIAQGAKPGEGGELPGHKVDQTIAKTRHSTPGVGLISPPPHHDIYSIEDLAQLIYDLKNANRAARISVKLVAETGVGTIAAGVAKGKADGVLISGHDGGTGASPLASIKYAGLPWEIGLAETQQTLVMNDLRGRIRVQTDGGLKTGRDVAIAALLGADEFGFSTAPLVAMGCILMRVCHLNTCPVGIATQNPELRKRFAGQPEHVVQYLFFVAEELREIMAKLGMRKVEELVGRSDLLDWDRATKHWKAKGLDFSQLLHKPDLPYAIRHCATQDHGLDQVLDVKLLEMARPALETGERVELHLPIRNTNRTVGTILGSEISRKYGEAGLPEDTITIHFTGSAGQSFGAFAPRGMSLWAHGDTNDYCGKGLSGAKIVVKVPEGATYDPAQNIITGNVALYGATAGEAYFQGIAGERFAVRNSGAQAVVEGVGDHGCEYMTGGRVVILGPTGRNFGAGMSGGFAYVLDPEGSFPTRVNPERIDLERLTGEDEEILQRMVRRHYEYTRSERAEEVLRKWNSFAPNFVKVFPKDLKLALDARLNARTGDG
ncbi:MAG: glutamate synthase large subunit [Myxococcota bacterium]|jgi:glutamate synthase domain-containing protein 2/glutamate synthase domain-containing protein 1/glutamate synthase domain-containing protein 3|nr:glutamate synthase large subunit [Myxococcota bacterium]